LKQQNKIIEPDNTAVRTALWRAMHVQMDAKPHILEDEVGLKLYPTLVFLHHFINQVIASKHRRLVSDQRQ